MLAQFPGVPVVLDHCGFPDLAGGPPFPAAQPLFALAGPPRLHLKVTSHVLEAAERARPCARRSSNGSSADVRSPSDWCGDPTTRRPTTARTPSSSRSDRARRVSLPWADRDAVLGGNALRLWPALANAR